MKINPQNPAYPETFVCCVVGIYVSYEPPQEIDGGSSWKCYSTRELAEAALKENKDG